MKSPSGMLVFYGGEGFFQQQKIEIVRLKLDKKKTINCLCVNFVLIFLWVFFDLVFLPFFYYFFF